jgi:hypothetical protein
MSERSHQFASRPHVIVVASRSTKTEPFILSGPWALRQPGGAWSRQNAGASGIENRRLQRPAVVHSRLSPSPSGGAIGAPGVVDASWGLRRNSNLCWRAVQAPACGLKTGVFNRCGKSCGKPWRRKVGAARVFRVFLGVTGGRNPLLQDSPGAKVSGSLRTGASCPKVASRQ